MTNTNIILHNLISFVHKNSQGSSLIFSALGGRGKEKKGKPAAKNFVAESEGAAEGGCGGNSAAPERNQIVDSPAVLLESAGHHRKILFSLGKKETPAAKNFAAESEGAAEGGCGGYSAAPERWKPRRSARILGGRNQAEISLSLIEKISGARTKEKL